MRQKWKNGFWPFWHQFWFGLLQWLQTCILVVSKPHWRIQKSFFTKRASPALLGLILRVASIFHAPPKCTVKRSSKSFNLVQNRNLGSKKKGLFELKNFPNFSFLHFSYPTSTPDPVFSWLREVSCIFCANSQLMLVLACTQGLTWYPGCP